MGQGRALPPQVADKARNQFAFADGARRCEQTIEILDRHGGADEARLEALERLGDLRSLLGKLSPANEAYDRALEVAAAPEIAGASPTSDTAWQRRLATAPPSATTSTAAGHRDRVRPPDDLRDRQLQPVVETLCQDSRVITLDPRGTGRSSPLAGPYLLRDHVEDLRAVVEAAVGGPAVLVGLSTGAAVATTFAARYPHLADKLVLCGGSPAPSNAPNLPYSRDAEYLAYLAHRRSLLDVGDDDSVLKLFFERALAEPGTQQLIEGGRQAGPRSPPRRSGTSSLPPTRTGTCGRSSRRSGARRSCFTGSATCCVHSRGPDTWRARSRAPASTSSRIAVTAAS